MALMEKPRVSHKHLTQLLRAANRLSRALLACLQAVRKDSEWVLGKARSRLPARMSTVPVMAEGSPARAAFTQTPLQKVLSG